jgi:hypothetical protein
LEFPDRRIGDASNVISALDGRRANRRLTGTVSAFFRGAIAFD